jgi:hypothetical protein
MKLFKTILLGFSLCLIANHENAQVKSGSAFTESEIVLKASSGGEISGTLTVPGKIKKSPLVLIIAGSGTAT